MIMIVSEILMKKNFFQGYKPRKSWSNKGDVLHDFKGNAFIIISIKQGRIAKEKGDGFSSFLTQFKELNLKF